jgi:DegV family protein with EDD domain
MDPHIFYQRMLNGENSRTSQVNMSEYMEFWTPYLKEGKDIIHLTLSSGISGTVNSARAAAEELRREFPSREIYVVDSLAASSGYGLLVVKLAELRDSGYSLKDLYRYAEDHKLYLHHRQLPQFSFYKRIRRK